MATQSSKGSRSLTSSRAAWNCFSLSGWATSNYAGPGLSSSHIVMVMENWGKGKKRMQTTRQPSNQLSILVWTNPAESFLLEAITQDDQVKDPLRANALRCSAWGHCSSQPLMCSFRALTYNSEHAKTCYVTMWNQESARGDLSQPQRPSTIETENLLRDNSQLETWDDQQTWATHPWILAVQLQCLQLDPMHILNPKHITSVASAAKGWTMIDMLNVRLVVKNKWIMEWQWRMISMVYSL